MIMHVISDFTSGDGAQTMLARLLRVSKDDRLVLASLLGVSDALKRAADNPRVRYEALGLRSPLAAPAAVLRLARLIRAERPSAILCWMYHAMPIGLAAARLAGTGAPVYWTVRQALDDPEALTGSTRGAIALARRLSALSSGVIYNSQRALEQHAALGFSGANATVIPNGFDLPSLGPAPARAPTTFGLAGRLHRQKDHETFFRAAAAVARVRPTARFELAGAGVSWEAPEVRGAIEAAGLPADRVALRGRVANMADFYESIDALVLSSRTEGFPNVVAEAMSFGKPVVSTDVGDAAEIVGSAGVVVPPRDPVRLAEAMLAMLDLSPEAFREMSRTARLRVEQRYALPKIAERYEAFLRPSAAAPRGALPSPGLR